MTGITRAGNGYALAGGYGLSNGWYKPWVVLTDTTGKQLHQLTMTQADGDAWLVTIVAAGEDFIAAGNVRTTSASFPIAYRVSADGKLVWSRRWSGGEWSGPPNTGPLLGLAVTGSDELVATGFWQRTDSKQGRHPRVEHVRMSDGLPTLRTNLDDNNTSHALYGFEAAAVLPLTDGLILAGGSDAKGPMAAVRTDPWLNLDCKTAGACADKQRAACEDGKPCTIGDCNAGTCAQILFTKGTVCHDDNPCAATEQCDGNGQCIGAKPNLFAAEDYAGDTGVYNYLSDMVRVGDDIYAVGGYKAPGKVLFSYFARYRSTGERVCSVAYYTSSINGAYLSHEAIVVSGSTFWVAGFGRYIGKDYGSWNEYDSNCKRVTGGGHYGDAGGPVTAHRGFWAATLATDGQLMMAGGDVDKTNKYRYWVRPGWGGKRTWKHVAMQTEGRAHDIATLPGKTDSFVIVGEGGHALYLDTDGNQQALVQVVAGSSQLNAVKATKDGGVVIAGWAADSAVGNAAVAYGLGADRKLRWKMADTAIRSDWGDIHELPVGGFAVHGSAKHANGAFRSRVAVLDPKGAVVRSVLLNQPGDSNLAASVLMADGTIYAVGRSWGGSAAWSHAFRARVSLWGHASCVTAGLCASKPLTACDDADPCTADTCLPAKGCAHTAIVGCK